MLLFCPSCRTPFTGVSRCPRCGGLLLMPEETASPLENPGRAAPPPYKPTPAGRAVVGTAVALGLYLGIRKVATGWALVALPDSEAWWLTADGLATIFTIQVFAASFGAVLAAAGRSHGISLGAAVGAMCGGLFLAAEVAAGASPGQLVLLLQPVLLAVAGAIAGAVGAWVWAAVPELDMPVPSHKTASSILLETDVAELAPRPTAWFRVIAGAAVIVAGMALADTARSSAEKVSRGYLKVESRGQGKFLSWQIATLVVIAGGVWAGAATGSGLRHGIYAGVLGGIGVVALMASRGELTQPEEYLLSYLNVATSGSQDPIAMAGVAIGVLLGSLVGGWFGGQLFLPLAPMHMRKRRQNFGMD